MPYRKFTVPSIGSTTQRTPVGSARPIPRLPRRGSASSGRRPASSPRITSSVSVSTTVTGSVGWLLVATELSVRADARRGRTPRDGGRGRARRRSTATRTATSRSVRGSSDVGGVGLGGCGTRHRTARRHAPSVPHHHRCSRRCHRRRLGSAPWTDIDPRTVPSERHGHGSSRRGFGIDVGGSGVKGGLVDLQTGELIGDRIKIVTPQPATPEAIAETVAEIVARGRLGRRGRRHAARRGHRRDRAHRGQHRQVLDRNRRRRAVRARRSAAGPSPSSTTRTPPDVAEDALRRGQGRRRRGRCC